MALLRREIELLKDKKNIHVEVISDNDTQFACVARRMCINIEDDDEDDEDFDDDDDDDDLFPRVELDVPGHLEEISSKVKKLVKMMTTDGQWQLKLSCRERYEKFAQ